jgi:hypothetical protein
VDFRILKKVIYSAGLAGYVNISFVVQEKGKERAAAGHP